MKATDLISFWFLPLKKYSAFCNKTVIDHSSICPHCKYIIGDGNNMYDFTYVENVAHAHVCAERTLASEVGVKKAAGQVSFLLVLDLFL